MHIKTGNDRIVIIFPKLGFVLKVARFGFKNLESLLDILWTYFTEKKMKEMINTEQGGLRKYLGSYALHAIYENLREKNLYKKTKHPFLWPTWFSFYGIVNIQPYAKKVLNSKKIKEDLWILQVKVSTEMYCMEHNHSWHSYNFCIDENGQARMLDYGAWCIGIIVEKYGERLLRALKPDYILSDDEIDELRLLADSHRQHWKENRLKYDLIN